jgi:hypothetical protein
VIPQIHDLLETKSLPEELERLRTEGSISTQAPDWISLAPTRSDFWMTSSGGDDLSSLGCMPLSCCVTPLQYNAVLTTLKQLSDLEMLLLVEGVELLKLCNKLQALRGKSKHPGLLDSLMKGLTSGEIRVYKGLDTGFKIPDESSHMWGLSSISAKGFDIFVSQKASSDIGVVLHTYLAYHGVPRLQRYEEELNLEIKDESRETPRIPINVRSELTDSTPSELLFLIQQMRMSNVQTPLTDAIHDVCSRNLIGAPSQDAWIETCAKGFLEGSVSIEDVLQQRLEDLARRGAVRLPDVDSLGVLYEAVNQLVALALFSADRETLDCLLSSLSTAYGPSQSISKPLYVDINTDLFALILFCVLRKAAFEDVYIEATDRCPFFLTQPDQAAVFSELWVLGSQCEIYFGLRPRALGRIIYDNYRAFLRQYPPVDLWDGKDNFTAYSFSQITEISETTKEKPLNTDRTSSARRAQRKLERTASSFGALSIFCVPAIVDVCLLTTSGRGFFLTAFMRAEDLAAATYALLASLLITAWVTGWVGSVGSMYLHNWAFDNMNMFLTQRLSGGFVITLLVGICGFIAFSVQLSLRAGSVFAAYLLILSTYLNLLGKKSLRQSPSKLLGINYNCRYYGNHAFPRQPFDIGPRRSVENISHSYHFASSIDFCQRVRLGHIFISNGSVFIATLTSILGIVPSVVDLGAPSPKNGRA